MPRKKQGLRSYHHKSRNGCMQCKRRRVKCGMQHPICASCLRRTEFCEYPPVDERSATLQSAQWGLEYVASSSSWALSSSFINYCVEDHSGQCTTPSTAPILPDLIPNPTESRALYCERTRTLLHSLLQGSWFSSPEVAMWTTAVSNAAPMYPYLQHCIQALAHLKDHNEKRARWPPQDAYQHQLMASSIFREATPTVNQDNWLAVRSFAVIMLIFQFGSQNTCEEDHFDLIETLQALRSTMIILKAGEQYFRQTQFWELIVARTAIRILEPDFKLRAAMHSLSFVVLNAFQDVNESKNDTCTTEINRNAFLELEKLAVACQGQPRRWDQYAEWPGSVSPEFLDLLASGDDIALLILIHWAAIMARSRKHFVRAWSIRAGISAIDRLKGDWSVQLAWPLEILIHPQLSKMAHGRVYLLNREHPTTTAQA